MTTAKSQVSTVLKCRRAASIALLGFSIIGNTSAAPHKSAFAARQQHKIHRRLLVPPHPRSPKARSARIARVFEAAPISAVVAPPKSGSSSILLRMLEAEQHNVVFGNQVTSLTTNRGMITSQQYIVRNGTHAISLTYQTPLSVAGEQVVDNGRICFHYVPSKNTLEIGPSRLAVLRNRIRQVEKALSRGELGVAVVGSGDIAGRACTQVEVRSTKVTAGWRRFWVDNASGSQLGIEQYRRNGERTSSTVFGTVSVGGALPPNAFRPPKTPNTVNIVSPQSGSISTSLEESQTQVKFQIRQPSYLPAGFHLQSTSVENLSGQQIAAMKYSNGLNVISIYESAEKHNSGGRQTHPRHGVVTGSTNGVRAIIVGNIEGSELVKIFASL